MIVLTIIIVALFFTIIGFGAILALLTDGERERNPDYWDSLDKMKEEE